jgi:GNAT superfamily N-acetyltransferase
MIRKIKKEELNDLLELYTHMHDKDDPLPGRDKTSSVWDEIINDPKVNYFVLEHDGRIVTCCHLVIVPNLSRGARPYGLIENVVTHKDFRRKGFGKSILKHALEYAWSKNCYKVMLMTGRINQETFHFYESVGFGRHGKQAFIARQ